MHCCNWPVAIFHEIEAELSSSRFAILKHGTEGPALKGLQNRAQGRDRREGTLGFSEPDSYLP